MLAVVVAGGGGGVVMEADAEVEVEGFSAAEEEAWMREKRCFSFEATSCRISERVGRGLRDLMLRFASYDR